jgi:hypothetical protein
MNLVVPNSELSYRIQNDLRIDHLAILMRLSAHTEFADANRWFGVSFRVFRVFRGSPFSAFAVSPL